jgi:hypothetical protein
MSETPAQQIDLTALNALLQTVQQQGAGSGANLNAWQQPAASMAGLNIEGVGVPISLQTPAGKVRCTIYLGKDHAQTPQALMQALETMSAAGMPIDAWQSSNQQGGGSWGGNNNGGGFRKRW